MCAVAAPERERTDGAAASPEGAATLETVIAVRWEELLWDGRCACPVCGGGMIVAAGPAGTCADCGCELA